MQRTVWHWSGQWEEDCSMALPKLLRGQTQACWNVYCATVMGHLMPLCNIHITLVTDKHTHYHYIYVNLIIIIILASLVGQLAEQHTRGQTQACWDVYCTTVMGQLMQRMTMGHKHDSSTCWRALLQHSVTDPGRSLITSHHQPCTSCWTAAWTAHGKSKT